MQCAENVYGGSYVKRGCLRKASAYMPSEDGSEGGLGYCWQHWRAQVERLASKSFDLEHPSLDCEHAWSVIGDMTVDLVLVYACLGGCGEEIRVPVQPTPPWGRIGQPRKLLKSQYIETFVNERREAWNGLPPSQGPERAHAQH